MARALIELAEEMDDAAIRALLREVPMHGSVSVAFTREPSFFQALAVEGRSHRVVVARDPNGRSIVGVGCCSAKEAYVNGLACTVGYLSSLRISEPWRNGMILPKAYDLLRDNPPAPDARIYLSTIMEDNAHARAILTSGRLGLPAYHDIGRFHAMAIDLRARRSVATPRNVTVRSATADDVPALFEFWNTEGRKRQFFPVYRPNDFHAEQGLLRGLRIEDILIAAQSGRIRGTVAGWRQSAFRQSFVSNYRRSLAAMRPIYNILAFFLHYPTLPKIGETLDYSSLALVCIEDNDQDIFAALLSKLMSRLRDNCSFLMAGMHERDSLLPALQRHRHFAYRSRAYVVNWEDGEADFQRLDTRVPYLELGAL